MLEELERVQYDEELINDKIWARTHNIKTKHQYHCQLCGRLTSSEDYTQKLCWDCLEQHPVRPYNRSKATQKAQN
jgi:hypothetical protein